MEEERVNEAMRVLLALHANALASEKDLDADLAEYVDQGFAKEPDGTLLSVAAKAGAHSDQSRFDDRTSYESFINKVHIDDWLGEDLSGGSVGRKLAQALLLSNRVAQQAADLGCRVLVAISCESESEDVVFRFHVRRADEPAWVEELQHVQEAILVRLYGVLR